MLQLLQFKLYELCSKLNKPSSGRFITEYDEKDRLCEVFTLCLQYDWMNDSDIREVWAENAFYCIAEYFKKASTMQDRMAASLDLFLTCYYGRVSLKPKFDNILIKAKMHPLHCMIFDDNDYEFGSSYLIREFTFFSATLLSPIVKQHPEIISPNLSVAFEKAKKDFVFASVSPERILNKMWFISAIIGSILDDM